MTAWPHRTVQFRQFRRTDNRQPCSPRRPSKKSIASARDAPRPLQETFPSFCALPTVIEAQGGLMLGTILTFVLLVSGPASAQAPEHVQLYDRGLAEYQRAN